MEVTIHIHLGFLSLLNTVFIFDMFEVDRARLPVHHWVQETDLKQRGGRDPAQITPDEMVVKVNGGRFWLVASIETDTTVILHIWLYHQKYRIDENIYSRAAG
jgi:transposase-like protein